MKILKPYVETDGRLSLHMVLMPKVTNALALVIGNIKPNKKAPIRHQGFSLSVSFYIL